MVKLISIFLFPFFLFAQDIQTQDELGKASHLSGRLLSCYDTTTQSISSASTWTLIKFKSIDTLQWNANPADGSGYFTIFKGRHIGRYTGVLKTSLYNGQAVNSAFFELKINKNDTLIQGSHATNDVAAQETRPLSSTFTFMVSKSDTTIWNESGIGGGFFTIKAYVYVNQTTCSVSNTSNATASGFNPTSTSLIIRWDGY